MFVLVLNCILFHPTNMCDIRTFEEYSQISIHYCMTPLLEEGAGEDINVKEGLYPSRDA